jgi:RNA polymerase sigma-70 factor (ECF subfamily)
MNLRAELELIARFQGGDQSAFGELVEVHQRPVLRLALQMLRDEESALDVAQEVFVRAYEEMPYWRGEARLGTWLYRTTLNACFELIRVNEKHRRIKNRPEQQLFIVPRDNPAGDEVLSQIDRAVRQLPERQRAVFVLKHYNDLRFKEIGQLLEITEGGVKASYHKALVALRALLAEHNPWPQMLEREEAAV